MHGTAKRRSMMETGRPTTLSMIKTGMSTRTDGLVSSHFSFVPLVTHISRTRDKIAMMEAKLRQMEATKPRPPPSASAAEPDQGASTSASTTALYHPSLPLKPPPPIPTHMMTHLHTQPRQHSTQKPKTPLPSLPILSSSQPLPQSMSRPPQIDSKTNFTPLRQGKSSRFAGVKIGRPKEKVPLPEEDG